jgi:glycosyltransferase involved in cell wall biosynthesis
VPINKNCGIINKAVEAMAAGLVVVGFEACFTALTQARNGEHYLAGNTFQDLTAHINRALNSPDQATKIGTAAQQVAHKFYSWDTRSQAFKKLYSQPKPDNNSILVPA